MKRIILTGPVVKVLAAFATIAVLVLFVYSMAGPGRPSESNRIATSDGEFSIIKPSDWTGVVTYAPSDRQFSTTITCEPEKSVGVGPRIAVSRRLLAPEDSDLKAKGFVQKNFQSKPAWIFEGQVKRDYLWRVIFERNSRWYEIALRLTTPDDVEKSWWWAFLNSFESRDVPTTQPRLIYPTSLPQ